MWMNRTRPVSARLRSARQRKPLIKQGFSAFRERGRSAVTASGPCAELVEIARLIRDYATDPLASFTMPKGDSRAFGDS